MFSTGVNDDLLMWPGDKTKPIIDPAVFSTVQSIRPAMCTKRGSDVPFRRINADPRDPEDNLTAKFEDDDLDAILPSLISIVDKWKPTMRLLKETPKKEKRKRTSSQASLDAASGRNARPHTTSTTATPLTYSLKLAREVAGWLVALHPDHVAAQYDSWRNVHFAAIAGAGAQTGAPPDFIEMLQEFTRPRRAAQSRGISQNRQRDIRFCTRTGR